MKPERDETAEQYMRRMHNATDRNRPRRGVICTCPPEYSRCRYSVAFDHFKGDHSRGHGGWGWPEEKVSRTTQA